MAKPKSNGIFCDGTARLLTTSLGPNSPEMTYSLWFAVDPSMTIANAGALLSDGPPLATLNFLAVTNVSGPTYFLGIRARNVDQENVAWFDFSVPNDGAWHHLIASFKADVVPTVAHAYLDDVALTPINKQATSMTPFNYNTTWAIAGLYPPQPGQWIGGIAEFWMDSMFFDLTNVANRRMFLNFDGTPAYLGKNGELPTGADPRVYLDRKPNQFHVNAGTQGDFVKEGNFSKFPTDPQL